MLRDARTVRQGEIIESAICVVGAGAAGITVARELSGQPFAVCVLESGGVDPGWQAQRLLEGDSVGVPYEPLHWVRSARLGGTTDRWNGRCRPLDETDLEKRSWVPHSGWPLGRADLDPYYARAHAICQLGPFSYEPEVWQDPRARPALPLRGDRAITTIYQFSPPTRFGSAYRDELRRSANVAVYLHASVVELEVTAGATAVTTVRVACPQGLTFRVRAKIVVLAAGGIENARLLLLSDRVCPAGLGNGHDLVGRYFMEHLQLRVGTFVPSPAAPSMGLYREHTVRGTPIRGALALSPPTLRQEELLNQSVLLAPPVAPVRRLLLRLRGHLRRRLVPEPLWFAVRAALARRYRPAAPGRIAPGGGSPGRPVPIDLLSRAEQAPNPASRVTLGADTDALGRRRARLDWRLSPLDKRSMRRAVEIIGEEITAARLGTVHVSLDGDDLTWPVAPDGGYHHMGTTRMHADPREGVVDEHCRVHGLANLFVAGSSVFPTGGYANPTLTLVALAVRLADHVKRQLT